MFSYRTSGVTRLKKFAICKKIETNFHPFQFLCQLFYMFCKIKNVAKKHLDIASFLYLSHKNLEFYRRFRIFIIDFQKLLFVMVFIQLVSSMQTQTLWIFCSISAFFLLENSFSAYRRQIGFFCSLRAEAEDH